MPKGPREDLADKGLFRPGRTVPPKVTREVVMLTGDDLVAPEAVATTRGFTAAGVATLDVLDMVASTVDRGGKRRFFVKFGPDGRMLDPLGLYTRPEDLKKDDGRLGRARYEFREVAESSFSDYIHYLRKHDKTFLRRAERAEMDS